MEGNYIDKDTFRQLTESAEAELVAGHLNSALNILHNLLCSLPHLPERPALKEQSEAVGFDYQRMLHFMAEGMDDPSRTSLHTRLIQKTFRILQDLRRSYHIATDSDIYSTIAKSITNQKRNPLPLGLSIGDFEAQDSLFDILWTSPQLHSDEEQQLRLFLVSVEGKVRLYMLSALTLSLLHYFDAAKIRLIIPYCTSEHAIERARAVPAVCIVSQLYSKIIDLYPTLREDMIMLSKSQQFEADVTKIQHFISLYQDTERLQQRMEKEIIPTLIKVTQQRRKLGFNDMEIDLTDPESTPQVSRKTRKILTEGMEEMARLFSEGMDINLGTFTSLKGYSFFQRPCHWLLPFDTMRPEFPGINTICNVPICDSDKYSVCLLIKHIPQSQREDIIRLLEGHAEVLAMQAEESRDDFQNVIQCLYRLLRRSPWRTQWSDIFTKSAMLLTSGLLGAQLRHSQEFLQSTAKTLLRHHHYEMAELHLRAIAELTGTDYSVLMNLALCAQEQGKFRQASNYYQQASMLNSNDRNILYRLQYCYAQQQRYSDQLDCMLQLEKIVPDNTKIQTEIGLCLIQLESWEDAQKRFYKLEFSGVNHQAILRAIAWCALKMNDLQEAQKYYTRIIEESTHATWEDYLNAGHVAWLQGDIRSAINLYTEYVRRYATARPNSTDIMQPFVQDGDILRNGGISDSDINIMYDLIAWQPTNK